MQTAPNIQVVNVTGMTCGHCVLSIKSAVGAVDGVTDVDVDLSTGQVTITSDGPVDLSAVGAAVDDAGYELAS